MDEWMDEWSPRWNLMSTQFVFIHNRVLMGFQWMMCWWLLDFTIWGTQLETCIFFKAREVGPWIHGPRPCPKLAYQGNKIHEFAHGKCFVFLFKNTIEQDLYVCLLCQVCGEVFFHNLGEWSCGERERERERESNDTYFACRL